MEPNFNLDKETLSKSIYEAWINEYQNDASPSENIIDLAKEFNTSIHAVVDAVFDTINTEVYQRIGLDKLKGIYRLISMYPESEMNQIEMEIIDRVMKKS